ncbi:hypothetical protein SHIRM173S_09105 [Streptomyces hirsutus]
MLPFPVSRERSEDGSSRFWPFSTAFMIPRRNEEFWWDTPCTSRPAAGMEKESAGAGPPVVRVGERTVSWPVGCRRLLHRYERKAGHFLAFAGMASDLSSDHRDPTAANQHQVVAVQPHRTERVSALEGNQLNLGRDRPIGEARLLWEIGEQGQDVRRLRERLGLDSGYVSRLLRSLEADGLVGVEPHPRDRRVRTVRLTDAGRAGRAELGRRSDDLAGRLLGPLNSTQRARRSPPWPRSTGC